jgi:hypothetical protein
MKGYALLFAGAVGAGVAAGALGTGTADGPRAALAASAAAPGPGPASFTSCAGGAESPLGVELEPTLVEQRGGGEVVTLTARLDNRFGATAAVRHGFELVDDLGQPVRALELSPRLELARDAHDASARFATPPGLADGYYAARLTAVGKGAGRAASEIVSFYFVVDHGAIEQLDQNDWFMRSRAHLGVRL